MKATVAALLLSGVALGASAEEAGARWYIQVDNDVLFGTDRWYTSGVHIARVERSGNHDIEWGLTQEIYTPEGKRFEPGTVDRAPVGRLLLSGARHDIDESGFQTLELSLGVRGRAALGRRTTGFIHHVAPAPYVDWSREEKSRVDAMAAATRSFGHGDAVIHLGGVAGNSRTFAHVGAQYGFGPTMYTPVMRFIATPPPARGRGSWSGFIGTSARAVVFDRLVERSYDALLPQPSAHRFVGRVAAGVGTVQHWGSVSLSAAMDSREFEGQRVPHRFGSLMVHLDF